LAVAVALLGLGAATAFAAGPARTGAPLIATTTGPITASVPPTTAIVSKSILGFELTLTISCKNGSPGRVCSGPITLTSGGQNVGSGSYSVANGMQTTVYINLNATGQSLLSTSSKLAATLSLGGATTLTRTVHFHDQRLVVPISNTWGYTVYYTFAEQLELLDVPGGSTVEVTCHGGGCPFASNSFTPGSDGSVNLEPSFAGKDLRAGAKVEIEVTHRYAIGDVVTFKIRSLQPPSVVQQCLQPGASKPSRCG
jgi:hypothetical protein